MTALDLNDAAAPGLARRLAAMFYDSWLVAAIWLVGVTLDTVVRDPQGLALPVSYLPLQLYLVAAPAWFFGWFWTHGGQTLGMRAWRLKLLTDAGQAVTWRKALLRYAGAWLSAVPLGLGYLWVLFDRDAHAWHDRLSGTRLVMLRKP